MCRASYWYLGVLNLKAERCACLQATVALPDDRHVGGLYALDIKTGDTLWTRSFPYRVYTPVAVGGDPRTCWDSYYCRYGNSRGVSQQNDRESYSVGFGRQHLKLRY